MQLTSVQKLSMYIGAALIVLGIFGGMSYYFSSRLVESDRAVERANTNMSNAFRLMTARQEAERLAKAYVVRPDTATRRLLQSAQSQVEDAIDAMAKGTEDNPHQVRLMKELGTRAADSFESFRATLLVRDRAGPVAARRVLSRALPGIEADTLMAVVAHFRNEELRVLAEQTRLQSAHSETAQRIILFGMVLTFLLAAVALQPMRSDVSARLMTHIVREHEIATGALFDETRPPPTLPPDSQ
jgi:CHASE3 domain sensor protein